MYSFAAFQRLPAGIQRRQDSFASGWGWGMGIALPLPLIRDEQGTDALCLSDDAHSTNQKRIDFQ